MENLRNHSPEASDAPPTKGHALHASGEPRWFCARPRLCSEADSAIKDENLRRYVERLLAPKKPRVMDRLRSWPYG